MFDKFKRKIWNYYAQRVLGVTKISELRIRRFDDRDRLILAGFKIPLFREYIEAFQLGRMMPPFLLYFLALFAFAPGMWWLAFPTVALALFSLWANIRWVWFDQWGVAQAGFVFLRDGSVAYTVMDDLGFVHGTEEPKMTPANFNISDIRSIQAEPMQTTTGAPILMHKGSRTRGFVGHCVRVYLKNGLAINFVKRIDLDTATIVATQINEARRDIADAMANDL